MNSERLKENSCNSGQYFGLLILESLPTNVKRQQTKPYIFKCKLNLLSNEVALGFILCLKKNII